jgi:hypothetical protein
VDVAPVGLELGGVERRVPAEHGGQADHRGPSLRM